MQSTPDGPLYGDQGLGGAFGYLTEGGPGSNPLSFESLSHTIPESSLWPINDEWNWHCGNQDGAFGNLDHYTPPLNARYGTSSSAKEYLYKSAVASYESHRAMYEAYARNKYVTATGVINWMLNNAWPSNIWNLYDYYLNANGGNGAFFGTRKALRYKYGYHLMLSYTDNTVWLISSSGSEEDYDGDSIVAKAYIRDIMNGGEIVSEKNKTINIKDVKEDGSMELFTIDNDEHNLNIWLIQLLIIGGDDGKLEMDENIYWYSTQMDVLDWKDSTYYVTPCLQYADFTGLIELKQVTLSVDFNTTQIDRDGIEYYRTTVNISNPSTDIVAFMVSLRIVSKGDEMSIISPIFWSDNLLTIFPMEYKIINASYPISSLNGNEPDVVVQTYNDL